MPDTEIDLERGVAPGGVDPVVPTAAPLPPADPAWQPSDLVKTLTRRYGDQLRERPHEQLWFPHLLVRGAAGDTGQRPLWPPAPCWASPDIHLVPAGEPVDLSRTVVSPRIGEEYTVAVHVWNLGRFPAYGVVVRTWWVEPGWYAGTEDPRYRPHFIGGTFCELGDRDSGQAHRIVEIPTPWLVPDQAQAHACLFAVVESFADPWSQFLGSNDDRHVAQRNLTLIRDDDDASAVLDLLERVTEAGDRLDLHTGAVRRPSLRGAVARGFATSDDNSVDRGPIGLGPLRLLATAVRTDTGWRTARRARRTGVRLADLVAGVLGSGSTTAAALLAGTTLGGARSAALHLTTATSGYTILLSN